MQAIEDVLHRYTHFITPANLAVARLVSAAFALILILAPWLPMLNVTRSGIELFLHLGQWFTNGLPYSLIFLIVAGVIVAGSAVSLDWLVIAGQRAIAEGHINRQLTFGVVAIIILVTWMLTTTMMLTLLVILSPLALVVYEGASVAHTIPFIRPSRRWLVILLIFAGLCMWGGLVWLTSGAGGLAGSGFGYWLSWLLLIVGILIEMLDAWFENSLKGN